MTQILILSAGRRVSLVRGFQEAAKKHGLTVVTADLNPKMSSACQIAEKSVVLPHVLSDDYEDSLFLYCKQNAVRLVIPTIDTELTKLADMRHKLAKIGCSAIVCDKQIVDICRDKRETEMFFHELGINSPNIMDRNTLDYPVLVKPYDGSLSSGISILRSKEDLTKSIYENPKNIFCSYLDPSDYAEYTCDSYFDRNGYIRCVVPRLRVEVRGGEVSKGLTEKNDIVPFLFEKLDRIEGARGCLTIQIMRSRKSGEFFLIEVNPRFGGGYPLTAESGAAYHAWLIEEYVLDQSINRFDAWTDRLAMLRYDAEIFRENI